MTTRWQQLGAFVVDASAVSNDRLQQFYSSGGRWVVVLLAQLGYPDDHDPAVVQNLGLIDQFRVRCLQHGIACGGWFNGWAGGDQGTTALQDAEKVATITRNRNLGPVVLDCETPYSWPNGHPDELPKLVAATRAKLPGRSIGVSTIYPNDAAIWNGGSLGVAKSMRRLNVAMLPQSYNAPVYGGAQWMNPALTFQWLKAHGMEGNFRDDSYENKRAVGLSQIHPTVETTGLEGADLAGELQQLHQAKAYGFTFGFSIYTLEAAPDSDFALLAATRGTLFKT